MIIRVDCFMLCDGAQEVNGKLYILGGGWDNVFGQQFPLKYHGLSLAIRLSIPWVDTNQPHLFGIDLHDEDGNTLLPRPLTGELTVGRPAAAEPGYDLPVVLAINFLDVTFPKPGQYAFLLAVNGKELARAKLRTRQTR